MKVLTSAGRSGLGMVMCCSGEEEEEGGHWSLGSPQAQESSVLLQPGCPEAFCNKESTWVTARRGCQENSSHLHRVQGEGKGD